MNQNLCHDQWVTMLAEQMVTDVTDLMVGFCLKPCTLSKEQLRERKLEGVYSNVGGEMEVRLRFRAEPRFFARIAAKMNGAVVEDEEEIREYAMEYVNIICGRFLGELFRTTHLKLRCGEMRYVSDPSWEPCQGDQQSSWVCLQGEEGEVVLFSWISRGRDGNETLACG